MSIPKKTPKKQNSINLSQSHWDWINKHDVSRSRVIEFLVEEAIKKELTDET